MLQAIDAQPALVLAVLVLASYRAARLLVYDTVLGNYPKATRNPQTGDMEYADDDEGSGLRRLWFRLVYDEDGLAKNGLARWFADLSKCAACTGVWCSIGAAAAWFLGPDWLRWCELVAAVAGAQAFIGTRIGA
jgi:hypothetical protein